MSVVEQMLARYPGRDDHSQSLALREIMQELALAGLNRGGFFEKAAFYGGTCLRIFYGLPRFSEDLYFSLLHSAPEFSLEPYFEAIRAEFAAFGFDVDITAKKKRRPSDIESAFLKKTSSLYDLKISGNKTVKIKFEVDTDPPLRFGTEERLLLQPYSFYVKCFALPDLFAGKVHALLFRRWQNRVKGRDWFDFEWYIRQGYPLNLTHFLERARQSGDLSDEDIAPADFLELLRVKIENLDVKSAKSDVIRFVPDPSVLDIWSVDYFRQLSEHIRFT
jgi:predicted nucleotidyltransferase component of viral defense system